MFQKNAILFLNFEKFGGKIAIARIGTDDHDVFPRAAFVGSDERGGVQRTVQLWLNGEMTDATLTVKNGHYTVNYTDSEGNERERSGGGVAFEPDGTERALTEEELFEHLNEPEVEEREDGICYVQLEGGEKTIYMTIKRGNGYATSTTKYILPNEFNN